MNRTIIVTNEAHRLSSLPWDKSPNEEIIFPTVVKSVNVHPITSIRDMDMWKLWPTIQTKERISMSYEHEAPSKLTEAQKEMVKNIREMDKKTKGI